MSLRTRAQTHLHRRELDSELASGVDPNRGGLLAERARELLGEGTRRRLAASLERLLAEASAPPVIGLTTQVPIPRAAILDSRLTLSEIAERLDSPAFLSPQGVAMVSVLLSDGSGPLYGDDPGTHRELARSLEAALNALDHGPVLIG